MAQASADILGAATGLQTDTGLRWPDAWEPGDRPILVLRYDTADNKPPGQSMVWTLAIRSVIGPVLRWMAGNAPAGYARGGGPGSKLDFEYTGPAGLAEISSSVARAGREPSHSPAGGTSSQDSTDQGRS